MTEAAIEMLTVIACLGREKPLQPYCKTCQMLVCEHRGDGSNVKFVACMCSAEEVSPSNAAWSGAQSNTTNAQKRTRGFDSELDPTQHGVQETFGNKMKKIEERYPGLEPKLILKKLLGADLSIDEPIPDGRGTAVTGRQGGKMLACYLYSLEKASDAFLNGVPDSETAEGWLKAVQPKFALCPPQKCCIAEALRFLPKLVAAQSSEASEVLSDLFGD